MRRQRGRAPAGCTARPPPSAGGHCHSRRLSCTPGGGVTRHAHIPVRPGPHPQGRTVAGLAVARGTAQAQWGTTAAAERAGAAGPAAGVAAATFERWPIGIRRSIAITAGGKRAGHSQHAHVEAESFHRQEWFRKGWLPTVAWPRPKRIRRPGLIRRTACHRSPRTRPRSRGMDDITEPPRNTEFSHERPTEHAEQSEINLAPQRRRAAENAESLGQRNDWQGNVPSLR